jgi:hypothetical protein
MQIARTAATRELSSRNGPNPAYRSDQKQNESLEKAGLMLASIKADVASVLERGSTTAALADPSIVLDWQQPRSKVAARRKASSTERSKGHGQTGGPARKIALALVTACLASGGAFSFARSDADIPRPPAQPNPTAGRSRATEVAPRPTVAMISTPAAPDATPSVSLLASTEASAPDRVIIYSLHDANSMLSGTGKPKGIAETIARRRLLLVRAKMARFAPLARSTGSAGGVKPSRHNPNRLWTATFFVK